MMLAVPHHGGCMVQDQEQRDDGRLAEQQGERGAGEFQESTDLVRYGVERGLRRRVGTHGTLLSSGGKEFDENAQADRQVHPDHPFDQSDIGFEAGEPGFVLRGLLRRFAGLLLAGAGVEERIV